VACPVVAALALRGSLDSLAACICFLRASRAGRWGAYIGRG
jgi:hypothetical protein